MNVSVQGGDGGPDPTDSFDNRVRELRLSAVARGPPRQRWQ